MPSVCIWFLVLEGNVIPFHLNDATEPVIPCLLKVNQTSHIKNLTKVHSAFDS